MAAQDPVFPPPAAAPAVAPVLGPVGSSERIETVDILRGFAIFGIFAVNMAAFSSPMMLIHVYPDYFSGRLDRLVETLIVFLAQGKFYTLFSFLFGLGLALQMSRVEGRGGRFAPLYVRRLLVLLGIGAVHAFGIWMGDILVTYAVLGFVLLLLRKVSDRALATWFVVFMLWPLFAQTLGYVSIRQGWYPLDIEEETAKMKDETDDSFRAYRDGSPAEIFVRRAKDTLAIWGFMPLFGTQILALFVAGLWAGRRRIFENIPAHLPLLRTVRNWGLLLGLVGNAVGAATYRSVNPLFPSPAGIAVQVVTLIGTTSLSLFYISGLTLLMQHQAWRLRLAPLAAVGRTALSNYLFQSVVSTLIFYSYGLGLYGQVGPAAGLFLVVGVYGVQIQLSGWWLRRFRFGPLEWLWRSLTYGRAQPMRAAPAT